IQTNIDNRAIAAAADVIVLAVKPSSIKAVAIELADIIRERNLLVISVAAGVKSTHISEWIGEHTAVVRCMPNTAAVVRSAATGLYANPEVSHAQREIAESLLRSVGVTIWLDDEAKLDVVTALSGSGPAYFFLLMEAMQEAAVKLNLSTEEAKILTLQTALGAARLALESSDSVTRLREKVTSKGGTTERALEVLELGHLRNLVSDAITAAAERAEMLAEQH
nr:pyrroline-5-carboxylate reductase [Pseudomonadota bacterium]